MRAFTAITGPLVIAIAAGAGVLCALAGPSPHPRENIAGRAAPLPPSTAPPVIAPSADVADDMRRAHCANRLSIAFTGLAAQPALLAAADPQSKVGELLASPEFKEHFARFINSEFQLSPGVNLSDDTVYATVRYVLDETPTRPWSRVFTGPWRFDREFPQQALHVMDDPDGLGYFRYGDWMSRYAGNDEEQGLRLVSAYRMLQNLIGLELVPSTNGPGADVSQNGRMAQPCRSCHFDGNFPLDPVANILSRRHKENNRFRGYDPPPAGVAFTVGGHTVHDDKELVELLITTPDFQFHACRLAFRFLYGRNENVCEGPLFDRCMDAFAPAGADIASGKMQDALAAIAGDPSFCAEVSP